MMEPGSAPGIVADTLPIAFESACLVQCTDVGGQRFRPDWHGTPAPAARTVPALAEFNQRDAALRLAVLLAELGYPARHEVHTGGGWRRFALQRVLVAEPQRAATKQLMATAWAHGCRALLETEPLGSSSPRSATRTALASAAWRSVLLAAGRGVRAGSLWVRVGDTEIVAVLVRAARLLGVKADAKARPGGSVMVSVPAAAAPLLVSVVSPRAARFTSPAGAGR
jgi:hypothetical protein